MQLRILLFLISCCFIGNAVASDSNANYTLYLVRHAEKQADGTRDPFLTEAGQHRSEQLSKWLGGKGIKDIWSSDYNRTRDTAEPVVSSLGLELIIYDPNELAALAGTLMSKRHNALIVGHSNTTPELARLLCNCDIEDMDESEYDRLIVISVDSSGIHVSTFQQNTLVQP